MSEWLCGIETMRGTCANRAREGGRCFLHAHTPPAGNIEDLRKKAETLAHGLRHNPKVPRGVWARASALAEDVAEIADQLTHRPDGNQP